MPKYKKAAPMHEMMMPNNNVMANAPMPQGGPMQGGMPMNMGGMNMGMNMGMGMGGPNMMPGRWACFFFFHLFANPATVSTMVQ